MPQVSQIDGKVVDKQLKLEENRVRKIEIPTFFKQTGEIVCEGEPEIKVGLIPSLLVALLYCILAVSRASFPGNI